VAVDARRVLWGEREREREREGERERGREGGREGGRERGREDERERAREGDVGGPAVRRIVRRAPPTPLVRPHRSPELGVEAVEAPRHPGAAGLERCVDISEAARSGGGAVASVVSIGVDGGGLAFGALREGAEGNGRRTRCADTADGCGDARGEARRKRRR